MSLTEVCDALGISRTTAYTRIKDQTLKPIPDTRAAVTKIPRYRFDRAEIERLAQTKPDPEQAKE